MDKELDEIVYALQGNTVPEERYTGYDYRGDRKNCIENYHPTADTVEGRSQCWELAEKYEIEIDFGRRYAKPYNGYQWFQDESNANHYNQSYSPQVAVVTAVIKLLEGE